MEEYCLRNIVLNILNNNLSFEYCCELAHTKKELEFSQCQPRASSISSSSSSSKNLTRVPCARPSPVRLG